MEGIQSTSIMLIVSKSDEEFEQQHRNYMQKVLGQLQKSQNKCSEIKKTQNHLDYWYKHVEKRKELIHDLKKKTKNRKCTLLEREVDKDKDNRRTNMLTMARHKRCTEKEYYGIPKYIKENELLLKTCNKKVHGDCIDTYFKEQLKLNNATHLQDTNKYPSFDNLIVIGKKIEPQICIASTEESCEEVMDEDFETDGEQDYFLSSKCSFPLNIICFEGSHSYIDQTESIDTSKRSCGDEIENFLNKAIAFNVANDIFNSILNDIFKQNIFYLKMKFSSHNKDTTGVARSDEVDENAENLSIASSPSYLKQLLDAEKSSQKKSTQMFNRNCSFTRSPDYMLTYIQNKMVSKDYGLDYLKNNMLTDPKKSHRCPGNLEELKKRDNIKTFWLNMFFNMLDKAWQIERHIMLINGYEKSIHNDSSKGINAQSSSISKTKVSKGNSIASRSRSQALGKMKKSIHGSAIFRRQKYLQNQVRNSHVFKSMLYLQFRYLILDGLDYVCEVLRTSR